MRVVAAWSLGVVLISGAVVVGCGAAQEEPTVETEAQTPPPPPSPRAEPRIWDNRPAYDLGWPIAVKVGVINVGEVVVNVPNGKAFGVKVRARRVLPAPAAPETPPAAAAPEAGGETDAPAGGTGEAAAPEAPPAAPQPQYAEVECRDLPSDPAARGLVPLASTSNAARQVGIDELCSFDEPGRYLVEVVVALPDVEGADIRGDLEPVTLELEIRQPDPPVVARLVLERRPFDVGSPIEATARVTNWGPDQVTVVSAQGLQVELSAESAGEAVPCTAPGRRRAGRPTRLDRGQSVETTVDLAARCQLTLAGTYSITARVVVPRSGPRSFNGTLESPPVTIELVASEPTPAPAEPDAAGDAAAEE
jgi:hypothetical protein